MILQRAPHWQRYYAYSRHSNDVPRSYGRGILMILKKISFYDTAMYMYISSEILHATEYTENDENIRIWWTGPPFLVYC